MNTLTQIKMMITRMMGEEHWNRVLQTGGWNKFRKASPELALQVECNSELKDKYIGKRCFVIGNGPSLKSQDLSLLSDEYVFTCNQIMRNPIYPQLRSNFHFFCRPIFFSLKKDNSGDMEVYNQMLKINSDGNRPLCFFANEGYDFAKEFRLDNELDLRFFVHRLSLTDHYDDEIDFARFIPNLHTVVHYAIALAIFMGFSEIYLLGCDCTNIITAVNTRLYEGDGAEYAYNITKNEKARMRQRNSMIRMEDELRSFSEVFRAYRILYEYAKKRNIRMVNCTAGGLLDSVPRQRYEEVMNTYHEQG